MQNTNVIIQFYCNNMWTLSTKHNSNYYIPGIWLFDISNSHYNINMVVITTRCDVNDILFEINTWLLFVILLVFLMKNTKSTFEPQEQFFSIILPHAGDRGSNPVGTDLICQNRWWQLHCQTLSNRYECHGSLEMTIIKG